MRCRRRQPKMQFAPKFQTCMPTVTLEHINTPADLHSLDRTELKEVAVQLREFVLQSVSKTGGHLSSKLGTVELTIALHPVFNRSEEHTSEPLSLMCSSYAAFCLKKK